MKDKTASQLIWDYQRQEDVIEAAEKDIIRAKLEKDEVFAEIIKRPALLEALETTGITAGVNLYKVEGKNSATIEITPAPVADYSLDREVCSLPSPLTPEEPF